MKLRIMPTLKRMIIMNLSLDTSRVIGLYAPQKYGKTTITHYILEEYAKHIDTYLYDTDKERYKSYYDIKGLKFIYTKKPSDMEKQKAFNDVILAFRSKYSNCILAIEDIDKIIQSKIKTKDTLEIYSLASDSRHSRTAILYISKTPSYIPTTLRLNTNLFFFGKFVEPSFVKWITAIIPKEVYAKIKKPQFVMFDVWNAEYAIVQYDINKNKLIQIG